MVTMRFRLVYFDAAKVIRRMDAAARNSLTRAGRFIRKRAHDSIRKRKAISKPGQPPRSHAGQLRKLLFYAWDPRTRSIVIGPAAFKEAEAPNLLEFGGRVGRLDRRQRRPRTMIYRKRPFMGPAYEAERDQLPERFRNSLRGG